MFHVPAMIYFHLLTEQPLFISVFQTAGINFYHALPVYIINKKKDRCVKNSNFVILYTNLSKSLVAIHNSFVNSIVEWKTWPRPIYIFLYSLIIIIKKLFGKKTLNKIFNLLWIQAKSSVFHRCYSSSCYALLYGYFLLISIQVALMYISFHH